MRIYSKNTDNKPVSRSFTNRLPDIFTWVAPQRPRAGARLRRLAVIVLFCLPAWMFPASGQAGVDGVVFPFAKYAQRPGLSSASNLSKHEGHYGADLFGLASYKGWRFLGEYLVSDEEHDLERLELGRRIGNNTLLWVGRYHSPAYYWDILYHHAPFLQTSITRPQIVQWEDDGGVLPIHLWGLRADETITNAGGEWRFHIGFGSAPEMKPGKLEALNALHPKLFGNRLMGVAMASFLPDARGTDEAGVFASAAELPSRISGIDGINQVLAGGFVNWTRYRVHVNAAVFGVHSEVRRAAGASPSHTFYSGYLQLEYKVTPHWIPYFRYEGGVGVNDDPYLRLFSSGLANTVFVGGLRYEITQRQAVTLEGARYLSDGNHYSQLMVQWSGMFP